MSHPITHKRMPTVVMRLWVVFFVGIGSGLGGMSLSLLLHYIQHVAYGYSTTLIISDQSFLEGVRAASAERRVFVLTLCGFIAGLGWWGLYRYEKPISIQEAIASKKPHMPIFTTIANALLQIITIALGSPLGREVAPREIGALFACWLSQKTKLSLQDTRIMIACGAGAGLATAYNVPLGGAMFTLEVLLCTFQWSALLPALATAGIAVVVSWIGLGNEPTYQLPSFDLSHSLVTWSILVGPIFGYSAYYFQKITSHARKMAKNNWQLPVLCLLNFIIIGFLAIYFPALLGNGKSPTQLEFNHTTSIELAAVLLVLRILITYGSLRAGAKGGLLTPSLANGALFGVILGGFWSMVWHAAPLGAFAVIGATAFLAAAQTMPITAIILMFEFTRIHLNFMIPLIFTVAGAVGTCNLCQNKRPKTK